MDVLDTVATPVRWLMNLAAEHVFDLGPEYVKPASGMIPNVLGLPVPETPEEKFAYEINSFLGGTALTMGAGAAIKIEKAIDAGASFWNALRALLTEKPVQQMVTAPLIPLATAAAQEAGVGPELQNALTVFGAMTDPKGALRSAAKGNIPGRAIGTEQTLAQLNKQARGYVDRFAGGGGTVHILDVGADNVPILTREAEAILKTRRLEGKPLSSILEPAGTGQPGQLVASRKSLNDLKGKEHEARFIEERLANGNHVRLIDTADGARMPDYEIDGIIFELKTAKPLRSPEGVILDQSSDAVSKTMQRQLCSGRGQSENIVLDLRAYDQLTQDIIKRGIGRAMGQTGQDSPNKIKQILVIHKNGQSYHKRGE